MLYAGEKKNIVHVCLQALPNTCFSQWTHNIKPISVSSSTLANSVLLHPFQLCHCCDPCCVKPTLNCQIFRAWSCHFMCLLKHPACPWVAVTQEKVFGLRTWLAGVVRAHVACPKSCDSLPRHNGLP